MTDTYTRHQTSMRYVQFRHSHVIKIHGRSNKTKPADSMKKVHKTCGQEIKTFSPNMTIFINSSLKDTLNISFLSIMYHEYIIPVQYVNSIFLSADIFVFMCEMTKNNTQLYRYCTKLNINCRASSPPTIISRGIALFPIPYVKFQITVRAFSWLLRVTGLKWNYLAVNKAMANFLPP